MITNRTAANTLQYRQSDIKGFLNTAKERFERAQQEYSDWRELSDIFNDPDSKVIKGTAMKVTRNGTLVGYNGVGQDNLRDAYIHYPKSGGGTFHVVLETDGRGGKTYLLKTESEAIEVAENFVATGRKPKATPTKPKNR